MGGTIRFEDTPVGMDILRLVPVVFHEIIFPSPPVVEQAETTVFGAALHDTAIGAAAEPGGTQEIANGAGRGSPAAETQPPAAVCDHHP